MYDAVARMNFTLEAEFKKIMNVGINFQNSTIKIR